MTLLIGTDEAGYGPNLGPLVVAASVWRLTAADSGADRLAEAATEIGASAGLDVPPWADSKRLFKPGGGLGGLERGVLAALSAALPTPGAFPVDGAALASALGIDPPGPAAPPEWPLFEDATLPVAVDPAALARLAAAVATTLSAHGVQLLGLACRVVHPAAFNALLDTGLNKSDILSSTTLGLAAGLRDAFPGEAAEVWCDRHGGRKSYAALVGRHFDAPLVRTIVESPTRSAYELDGRALRIEFSVGGEARVPVALASMTAKYVRELAMAAFNTHWSSLVPGLQPTAGYPLDARRWYGDVAGVLERRGLRPDAIWRRA